MYVHLHLLQHVLTYVSNLHVMSILKSQGDSIRNAKFGFHDYFFVFDVMFLFLPSSFSAAASFFLIIF
jgi:hypothetical protein